MQLQSGPAHFPKAKSKRAAGDPAIGRGAFGQQAAPPALADGPKSTPVPLSHAGMLEQFDVGARLIGLVSKMRAIAGASIELDTDLALPHSRVRAVGAEFEKLILNLVTEAVAAGAGAIKIRSRLVGTRVWTLICDDRLHMDGLDTARAGGETAAGQALIPPLIFSRKSHGRLIRRSSARHGTSIALVLPTMLRMTAPQSAPGATQHAFKLERMSHEKDRQPTAA